MWTEENLRIKPLQDFTTLLETITPSSARVERAVPKSQVKQQNEAAMAELEGMLKGVHGVKRKRRNR